MHMSMVTLIWSLNEIFLHFLLIWSKWIPKSQTCPSQELGKIFYGPLKMKYVKNRKNPNIFVKNDQNALFLYSFERKLFVDYKNVVGFSPIKRKSYGRKTWLWHNSCESLDHQKDLRSNSLISWVWIVQ